MFLRQSRERQLLSFCCLSLFLFDGCYEEDEGPHVDTPEPATNACLELMSSDSGSSASAEDLLAVFDCINSEGAFDALGAPLYYVVDTGYLNPYFDIPGYLDPIDLSPYIESGDPAESIKGINLLLNDPEKPLDALLNLYIDFYNTGHLENILRLGQAYAAFLYEGCSLDPENCTFSVYLDMMAELMDDPSLQLIQEQSEADAAAMDPRVAEDIAYDMRKIIEATTSESTQHGNNLLLDLVAAFAINPLDESRYETATLPSYVKEGWTLLQALQQPLCQLRSNRGLIDAATAGTEASSGDQAAYLPLNLKTLTNYTPLGTPATTTPADETDHDGDGFSIAEGDCNDADPTVYKGADEVTDLKDNDCNLVADDNDISDVDHDGDKISPNQGDCDDTDASIYPAIKITYEDDNATITMDIKAPPEFAEDGTGDLKDNDCDGYTDHEASSLEILLATAKLLLPQIYALDPNTDEPYLYTLVETMASSSGTTLDPIALLNDNEDLIDDLISDLSNGILDAEMTVQVRNILPVVEHLATLGMLSSSSSSSTVLTAIWEDHLAYQEAYQAADSMTKGMFDANRNACGEDKDQYIDAMEVLVDLIEILDGYQVLDEPNLNELLPIVINSDLLEDQADAASDSPQTTDPELLDAQLHLFDYFLAPSPDSPGVYTDNYASARIWTLLPLLELLYEDPARTDEIDSLMLYFFDGLEDPDSVLYGIPAALEALAQIDSGGSIDREGVMDEILAPDARTIVVNLLAIPADPVLMEILLGNWDAVPADVRQKYETDESVFEFFIRWIENGTVGWFLDLAADITDWVVDNTSIVSSEPEESVEETPSAESTPVAAATPEETEGTPGH